LSRPCNPGKWMAISALNLPCCFEPQTVQAMNVSLTLTDAQHGKAGTPHTVTPSHSRCVIRNSCAGSDDGMNIVSKLAGGKGAQVTECAVKPGSLGLGTKALPLLRTRCDMAYRYSGWASRSRFS
jgi:hypothetical protein